uniref:OPA3-like protein n=1 Tax=Micromonas pusilla TaxID=38833 RepID=A0A7R9TP82_MICPS
MAIYVKAFSLVLKTASKPLAKKVKEITIQSPTVREFMIRTALRVDRLNQSIMSPVDAAPALSPGGRRMKIQTKDPKPRVMSPDQALTAAADFLGEAFVFAVAGGLVWWEAGKSQAKDDAKAAAAAAEREDLARLLGLQQRALRELTEVVREIGEFRHGGGGSAAG